MAGRSLRTIWLCGGLFRRVPREHGPAGAWRDGAPGRRGDGEFRPAVAAVGDCDGGWRRGARRQPRLLHRPPLRPRAGRALRVAPRADARAARAVRSILRPARRPHGVHRALHHGAARLRRGARRRERPALAVVRLLQRRGGDRLVDRDRHRRLFARLQLGDARAVDRPLRPRRPRRRRGDRRRQRRARAPKERLMNTLASGLSYIDLDFLGVRGVIATAVLHGPAGAALIDPGPASTLPALRGRLARGGIEIGDVRAILLTHIHLDHAGATGALARENPSLRVYVHENGAPHMVNPEKLIASASRLWPGEMDRLWGEFLPVPADRLEVLKGGERIEAGGRRLDIAYTPGHASHHVSYFCGDAGIAFVGDACGIRLQSGQFIMPPTPPPDIDLEVWRESLARIGAWRAGTLFVTHFGPYVPVDPHLTEMADQLSLVAGLVKASLARAGSDEEREEWFTDEMRRELRRRMPEADAQAYEVAGRFDLSWRGLARYWRKREGRS